MQQNSKKFLEESVYKLLQEEPYYAHFILESRIVYNQYGVTTAGASVVNGSTVLVFNTEFMNSLSSDAAVAVVKHEILHLLMGHMARKLDTYTQHANNIAMDCAINQHINDLPKECITVEQLEELCGKKLARFETMEYYLQHMAEAEKNKEGLFSSMKPLDDHDLDVPGAETNADMRKMAVKAASEKALGRAAGNVPSGMEKIIGSLQQPRLDWKAVLRNFVARSAKSSTQASRKKSHRRFELDQPGRKKRRELTLGVCMDVSGSVPDEDIAQFYAELGSMLPQIAELWLVQADCEVQFVEKVTRKSQLVVQRKGSGGTAYGPAITECKTKKCDAIVVFGDLDCADVPENPGVPVLWVTTGSDTRPGDFGSIVRLK